MQIYPGKFKNSSIFVRIDAIRRNRIRLGSIQRKINTEKKVDKYLAIQVLVSLRHGVNVFTQVNSQHEFKILVHSVFTLV